MTTDTLSLYFSIHFQAEQIAEFREVFNWFDKNHDEFINEIELGNAMRALGENPTQAELNELLQSIHSTKASSYSPMPSQAGRHLSFSTSHSHPHAISQLEIPEQEEEEIYRVAQYKIDFSQFLIMMAHKMRNPDDEKEVRDAFTIFDTNNDGTIQKSKLMKAMCTVGEPLTRREVEQLFQQLDDPNSEYIDSEDFLSFMLHDME